MQSEIVECDSPFEVAVPDNFKDPENHEVWRTPTSHDLTNLVGHGRSYAQKIRRRRKPVFTKHKPMTNKVPNYDHPMPVLHSIVYEMTTTNACEMRMATIHEEVLQHNKQTPFFRSRFSKSKQYQEKVSSLKAIVGRLQKLCIEKPDMLHDNIPEETIKLFKAIHI